MDLPVVEALVNLGTGSVGEELLAWGVGPHYWVCRAVSQLLPPVSALEVVGAAHLH